MGVNPAISLKEARHRRYKKIVPNGDVKCDMEMSDLPEREIEFNPLVTYSAKSLQYAAD